MIGDTCKVCNVTITTDWRLDFSTRKYKDLIYCSRTCSNSRRRSHEQPIPPALHCIVCNSSINLDWRVDAHQKRTVQLKYCSRACSNARTHSTETKQKISDSIHLFNKLKPKSEPKPTLSTNIRTRVHSKKKCTLYIEFEEADCQHCFNKFKYTKRSKRKRKFCSKICQNAVQSLRMQEVVKINGPFSTKRDIFTYKNITINVDSILEKAGIIYLTDVLNATRIERFNNIINYRDGDKHRTYNPDLICYINNKTTIVEVKQIWQGDQEHEYARLIPLKREALKAFCDSRNFDMLWLDFNAAPDMRAIYRSLLKK